MKQINRITDTRHLPDNQMDRPDRGLGLLVSRGDLIIRDNHPERFPLASIVMGISQGYEAAAPQSRGSGWKTYVADRQEMVTAVAADQNYVYMGTAVWGWGILDRRDMSLIRQYEAGTDVTGLWAVEFFGKPHLIVSRGGGSSLWYIKDGQNAQFVTTNMSSQVISAAQMGNRTLLCEESYNPSLGREEIKARIYDENFEPVWNAHTSGGMQEHHAVESTGDSFIVLQKPYIGRSAVVYSVDRDGRTNWSVNFPMCSISSIGASEQGVVVAGYSSQRKSTIWTINNNGEVDVLKGLGDQYVDIKDVAPFTHNGKQYIVIADKTLVDLWQVDGEAVPVPQPPTPPKPKPPIPPQPPQPSPPDTTMERIRQHAQAIIDLTK